MKINTVEELESYLYDINIYDKYEKEYNIIKCPKCGNKYLLVKRILRGFSDYEDIYCPNCGYCFGNFRVDMGYDMVEISDNIDIKDLFSALIYIQN